MTLLGRLVPLPNNEIHSSITSSSSPRKACEPQYYKTTKQPSTECIILRILLMGLPLGFLLKVNQMTSWSNFSRQEIFRHLETRAYLWVDGALPEASLVLVKDDGDGLKLLLCQRQAFVLLVLPGHGACHSACQCRHSPLPQL